MWSKRSTGEVVAVAELGDPVEHEPELLAVAFRVEQAPLVWAGDRA